MFGDIIDLIGAVSIALLAIYLAYLAIRGAHGLIKDTPWWRHNKENFLLEATGWIIAIILSSTALVWKNSLNANPYGIAALNGAVALVIRFIAPAVWVYLIWLPWSRQETKDPTIPMNLIEKSRVIGALSQGTISAAITSSVLASGKVEPDWLGSWWIIVLATSFACVTITKVGSIHQPIEIWHKLTGNKYRE